MSDQSMQPMPPSGGGGLMSKVLLGLVVVLLGAVAYLFNEINQTRADISQIHDSLLEEISKIHETNAVTSQTSRRSVETLKSELDAARSDLEQAMAGDDRDAINAAAEALETLAKPFAERRMDRGIREALAGLSMQDLESRVGEK